RPADWSFDFDCGPVRANARGCFHHPPLRCRLPRVAQQGPSAGTGSRRPDGVRGIGDSVRRDAGVDSAGAGAREIVGHRAFLVEPTAARMPLLHAKACATSGERDRLAAMRWLTLLSCSAMALFAQIPAFNDAGVALGHIHILVKDPDSQK